MLPLILATIGDTWLFVCAGGENEFVTFWREGLWNTMQQQHTQEMALFNVEQEPTMFFHSLEGLWSVCLKLKLVKSDRDKTVVPTFFSKNTTIQGNISTSY